MIVPMYKYSFLVYHRDLDAFLAGLMDVGVLHPITKGSLADAHIEELATIIKETETVRNRLSKRKIVHPAAPNRHDVLSLPSLQSIGANEQQLEQLMRLQEKLRAELEMLLPWGNFNPQLVDELEAKTGLEVYFFECVERKFDNRWLTDYPLEIINRINGKVYFIILQKAEEALPLVPVALPTHSLAELQTKLQDCERQIAELNFTLDNYALHYTAQLQGKIDAAKDELNLLLTTKSADALVADKLLLVEGWCPVGKTERLEMYAHANQVVVLQHPPNLTDKPPVLLKNNRFSQLFEPIGNLFSLPDYHEMDLTVFFAPFFLLFFGFCLGDAGYGLVLILLATLLKLKIKDERRSYLTLLQLFGASTTVIGFFSGTFFGFEMVTLKLFEPWKALFLGQKQLFNAALIIGFVQILFAMGVAAYKQIRFNGWLNGISRIGWLVALLSATDVFLLEKASGITSIMMWVGVGVIVLFGDPKAGWLKSIGMGLVDIYNITGVLGDLLSYIRLFALGVSSAILGLVVNSIAMSAANVPYVGIGLTILILLVGHTVNLLLASFSSFVHPMRLTFVEFYKNVGFAGGGKPYTPLARKSKN